MDRDGIGGSRCLGCMEELDSPDGVCPHCGYEQGSSAAEAYHLAPGTVLEGKYIVGRSLGAGGFGVTYIGYDALLGRAVAIKEYLPGDYATRVAGEGGLTVFPGAQAEQFAAGLRSFVSEARRLAALSEVPGIVRVYDSFEANGTGYIVMELLRGRTVKEALAADGTFAWDDALAVAVPVLEALQAVHAAGMVHRDIAPDNIYLCEDGSVRLIDFGAARYASVLHSRSLSVILKPGYAPEEQYRSKGEQGPWTDVYATAATLYKMLTGTTPDEAMDRSLEDSLKEPSALGAVLPKAAENAIMNALNVHAADRYQTAGEFLAALGSPSERRNKVEIKAPDAGQVGGRLKAAAVAAVTVAAAAVVGIGLGLYGLLGGGLLSDPSVAFADGYMNAPDVVNLTVDDAQAAVDRLGLYFIIADKQESDVAPAGRVLGQSPDGGTRIFQGEIVSVVVSAGTHADVIHLVMPDIVYKSEAEVVALLEEAGIAYDLVYEEHDTVAPGHVISQSRPAGEKLTDDDRVRVVVSQGSKKQDDAFNTTTSGGGRPDDPNNQSTARVSVPSVVGMSESAAASAINGAGLTVRTAYVRQVGTSSGQVLSQSLPGGSSAGSGSQVTITVSRGEPEWSAWTPASQMPGGVNESSYQVQYEDRPVTEWRYRVLQTQSSTETTTNTTGVTPAGFTLVSQQVTGYNVGGWGGEQSSTSRPQTPQAVGGNATVELLREGNVASYTPGDWGAWSDWQDGGWRADETGLGGIVTKQYEFRSVWSYSYTQYRYQRWVYWHTTRNSWFSSYSNGNVNGSSSQPWGRTEQWTPWFDNPMGTTGSADGHTSYGPYVSGDSAYANNLRTLWWNPQTRQVDVNKDQFRFRTRPVNTINTYTYWYRTRTVTPVTTYTYQKVTTTSSWGSWTGWSRDSVQASDTRQVETRQGSPIRYARWRPYSQAVY